MERYTNDGIKVIVEKTGIVKVANIAINSEPLTPDQANYVACYVQCEDLRDIREVLANAVKLNPN